MLMFEVFRIGSAMTDTPAYTSVHGEARGICMHMHAHTEASQHGLDASLLRVVWWFNFSISDKKGLFFLTLYSVFAQHQVTRDRDALVTPSL
mmetsp:Transcript_43393/g.69758  ORF Transcript_43393/g.69758 Transcript_43393/m.69758 type:complete len:92 (+) Transcript_43393:62-337(+)